MNLTKKKRRCFNWDYPGRDACKLLASSLHCNKDKWVISASLVFGIDPYTTPLKINIELENPHFEKEHNLPDLHFLGSKCQFLGVFGWYIATFFNMNIRVTSNIFQLLIGCNLLRRTTIHPGYSRALQASMQAAPQGLSRSRSEGPNGLLAGTWN